MIQTRLLPSGFRARVAERSVASLGLSRYLETVLGLEPLDSGELLAVASCLVRLILNVIDDLTDLGTILLLAQVLPAWRGRELDLVFRGKVVLSEVLTPTASFVFINPAEALAKADNVESW